MRRIFRACWVRSARSVSGLCSLSAKHSLKPLAQNRVALVGEAGHRLPPIGAQGLNLGFRDAAWIGEIAAAAIANGEDPGGSPVLARYTAARSSDVASRSLAVDLLNRSLLADFLPADLARGGALMALDSIPWLRQLVMRAGIEPASALPRLWRP